MKKLLGWTLVLALVVGGALAAFWPISGPAAWRLYDENWRPLALTEAENWCAGSVGINDGFTEHNSTVLQCVEDTNLDNEFPSITNSIGWACQGIRDGGWGGSTVQCRKIFQNGELWLLVGGGMTSDWNDERSRPVELDKNLLEDERTRENRTSGIEPLSEETQEEEQEEEGE